MVDMAFKDNISYILNKDRNSNITALERKGVKDVFGNYGLVDDLTMIYSGNRLWRVTDHAGEVLLENSGNLRNPEIFDPSETQFGYDSNGNTVKDLSRNIETMSYNAINLPLSARLAEGTDALTGAKTRRSVGYTYDASGVRHRVIHTTQPMFGTRPLKIATADTTDYVGNYVIRNGQIDKILTPYGYMQDGVHHTFLHDYQGNVAAVVVGDSVAQRNSYYPYGLPHVNGMVKLQSSSSAQQTANPYKYGGKEYDTFGGTDLYDFHARYHAPSTGRFLTVDPMCEEKPHLSGYAYCAGNPINLIDPSGMNEVDVDKETGKVLEFRLTDEKDVVTLIDSDGTGSEALYLSENNVITNVTLEHDSNGVEYDLYHITGDENADNIHRFLASGIKKEFSEIKTTSSDNLEKNYVMSSHHEAAEYGVSDFVEKLPWNQIVREWTHSHPGGTPYPSGIKEGGRDMGFAQKLSNRYTPEPEFKIFIPPGAGSTNVTDYRYINFNKNSLPSDF